MLFHAYQINSIYIWSAAVFILDFMLIILLRSYQNILIKHKNQLPIVAECTALTLCLCYSFSMLPSHSARGTVFYFFFLVEWEIAFLKVLNRYRRDLSIKLLLLEYKNSHITIWVSWLMHSDKRLPCLD